MHEECKPGSGEQRTEHGENTDGELFAVEILDLKQKCAGKSRQAKQAVKDKGFNLELPHDHDSAGWSRRGGPVRSARGEASEG